MATKHAKVESTNAIVETVCNKVETSIHKMEPSDNESLSFKLEPLETQEVPVPPYPHGNVQAEESYLLYNGNVENKSSNYDSGSKSNIKRNTSGKLPLHNEQTNNNQCSICEVKCDNLCPENQ